eukprot:2982465-Pleurochrysis_carterae.AAC.1
MLFAITALARACPQARDAAERALRQLCMAPDLAKLRTVLAEAEEAGLAGCKSEALCPPGLGGFDHWMTREVRDGYLAAAEALMIDEFKNRRNANICTIVATQQRTLALGADGEGRRYWALVPAHDSGCTGGGDYVGGGGGGGVGDNGDNGGRVGFAENGKYGARGEHGRRTVGNEGRRPSVQACAKAEDREAANDQWAEVCSSNTERDGLIVWVETPVRSETRAAPAQWRNASFKTPPRAAGRKNQNAHDSHARSSEWVCFEGERDVRALASSLKSPDEAQLKSQLLLFATSRHSGINCVETRLSANFQHKPRRQSACAQWGASHNALNGELDGEWMLDGRVVQEYSADLWSTTRGEMAKISGMACLQRRRRSVPTRS